MYWFKLVQFKKDCEEMRGKVNMNRKNVYLCYIK